MKCLFFFPLTFLLLFSSTVSSQNPNMFYFYMVCRDQSPACDTNFYNQAAQIVSDNLVLTRQIGVYVAVYKTPNPDTLGGVAATTTNKVDPDDGVTRMYPNALLRQLDPNFQSDLLDIVMEINSVHIDAFWFPGSAGSIQPNQIDFLEYILHQLHHGLGVLTSWGKDVNDNIGIGLVPKLDYDATNKFTFKGFYETLFDKYLISINDDIMTKTYTKALNDMAGPAGRVYNDFNDFFTTLRDNQDQEGKTYTKNMEQYATTKGGLGFLIDGPTANEELAEVILLDTHYNPPVIGKSIEHLSSDDYTESSDFLFIPEPVPGITFEDKVKANGDVPGGGVGPNLMLILETMGYVSRLEH